MFGMADSISFSKDIDSIVSKHKGENHIYVHGAGNLGKSILNMIRAGRIDYTITYPWVVSYFTIRKKTDAEFASFEIQESNDPIIYYAVCPKNQWGRERLKEIDNILRNIRPLPEYRNITESWLPEDTLNKYSNMYDSIFLKMN